MPQMPSACQLREITFCNSHSAMVLISDDEILRWNRQQERNRSLLSGRPGHRPISVATGAAAEWPNRLLLGVLPADAAEFIQIEIALGWNREALDHLQQHARDYGFIVPFREDIAPHASERMAG